MHTPREHRAHRAAAIDRGMRGLPPSGGRWRHLRMCQTCGHIGCCDSSPNQHAGKHASASGHPIARSAEPAEDWSWCYVDEVAFVVSS